MNTSATTVEQLCAQTRWHNAVGSILKEGVRLIQNIDRCCPSCVRDDLFEIFGDIDRGSLIAWTFGGDGHAYEWDDEMDTMLYQGDNSLIRSIYFHPSSIYTQKSSGSIIAAAFRANGFLVRWNGDESSLVEVFPNGK